MNNSKLKTWELSLLIALCISLCLGTWAQARQNDISGSLVRLHVLAASDERTEQELKLRVRDTVLAYLSPRLENAENSAEAQSIINANIDGIRAAAESVSEGRTIRVALGEEYYPTRGYEGFTLPAGRYESLRVTIGEGRGHNWWCVVFPPLCVSASQRDEAMAALSDDARGIVTESGEVRLKLRIVELWNELLECTGRGDHRSSALPSP